MGTHVSLLHYQRVLQINSARYGGSDAAGAGCDNSFPASQPTRFFLPATGAAETLYVSGAYSSPKNVITPDQLSS